MGIRRWFIVSTAAGALAAGGGAALANASGPAVPAASHAPAGPVPGEASVSQELQRLLVEEQGLSQQIANVKEQLAQAAASEQAKVATVEQQLASRQAALAQEANTLAAQEAALRQEAAQLAARASQQAASPGASAPVGDGGGGGDD